MEKRLKFIHPLILLQPLRFVVMSLFGWVAVGDPAQIFPPNEHDHICAIQEPLDFPRTVFGLERAPEGETIMPELTTRYERALEKHLEDKVHDS